MTDTNWILEHGYVSPDAVGHREYKGKRMKFYALSEALDHMGAVENKNSATFRQGSAASVIVNPTENVNVNIEVIHDIDELVHVIVVDESPLYFLRLRPAISRSSYITKTALYLANDESVQHDPMFPLYAIDYYVRHRNTFFYDTGRFFNEESELWVCPLCKAVYTDRYNMVNDFIIESEASTPFVTHTSCGGSIFLGDQLEIHEALSKAFSRINAETHNLYTYLHNGNGKYQMVCEYQDYCTSTDYEVVMEVAVEFIQEMGDEFADREVNNIHIINPREGLFKLTADAREEVVKASDAIFLLRLLTCIDYAIAVVRNREVPFSDIVWSDYDITSQATIDDDDPTT